MNKPIFFNERYKSVNCRACGKMTNLKQAVLIRVSNVRGNHERDNTACLCRKCYKKIRGGKA